MKKSQWIQLIFWAVIILTQCKSMIGGFDNPVILSIKPSDNAIAPRDAVIVLNFSKSMDTQMTENAVNLYSLGESGVSGGMLSVAGRIKWSDQNKTLTFTPLQLLIPNQRYLIRVTKSAEDGSGNDLNREYLSYFNAVGLQTDRPKFMSSVPANMQTGVLRDTNITLVFSKPIDRKTISAGISISPSIDYLPSFSDGDTKVILKPIVPLNYPQNYQVYLTQSLLDIDGNKLYEDRNFCFTVGSDFSKPMIISLSLEKKSSGTLLMLYDTQGSISFEGRVYLYDDSLTIDQSPGLILEFSKEMDQSKFATQFQFPVLYQILWVSPKKVKIIPSVSLIHGMIYQINLSEELRDTSGNPLIRNYQFSFRMGTYLEPLKINVLKVGPNNQDLLNAKELTITGENANKARILAIFSDSVDIGSFEKNFYFSPLPGAKLFQWSSTNKTNDTVLITLDKDLAWHNQYSLSFSDSIVSILKNPMEKKDYKITIGDDYISPFLSPDQDNGVWAEGGTQNPIVVKIKKNQVLDSFTRLVEKNDHFVLSFSEPVLQENLTTAVYVRDWHSGNKIYGTFMKSTGINEYHMYLSQKLESSGKYHLVLTNKITDLQGNVLKDLMGQTETYFGFMVDSENSSLVEVTETTQGALSARVWKNPYVEGTGNDPAGWIVLENMTGTLKWTGDPDIIVQDWILIHFNKPLDAHTVYGKISFQSLLGGNSGKILPENILVNVNPDLSPGGTCIVIKKIEFTSSPEWMYILKINGGKDGIKDIYGNSLKEDFEYRVTTQK